MSHLDLVVDLIVEDLCWILQGNVIDFLILLLILIIQLLSTIINLILEFIKLNNR